MPLPATRNNNSIPLAGGPTDTRPTRFLVGLFLIWSNTICAPGKSAPALLRLAIENYRKKVTHPRMTFSVKYIYYDSNSKDIT